MSSQDSAWLICFCSDDGKTLVKVEGTARLPLPPDRRFFLHVLDAASGLEKQPPVELFDISSTDLVAFVPVPPNVDMKRAEQIMVSTEYGSPNSDDYNNRLYFYEVIKWDPNDPDDPNRPPDDQSDGAGALATGLLAMLPALAALAL